VVVCLHLLHMQAQSAFDGTHQRVRREAWIWAFASAALAFASAALAAALLAWAAASRANLLQRERDRLSGQARAAELNLARRRGPRGAALRKR